MTRRRGRPGLRGSLEPLASALAERIERVAAGRALTGGSEPVRLTVVFLQWDPEAGPSAFGALDRRLGDLHGTTVRRYLVDNSPEGRHARRQPDGVVAVTGDNRVREFSGWQRGIAAARADGVATDVWLLANDRFPAYALAFLECLTTGTIEVAHALNAVVGQFDRYPDNVTSFGMDMSSWVRTAFYLVSDAVLARIGGPVLLDTDAFDEIMPRDWPGNSDAKIPDSPCHHRLQGAPNLRSPWRAPRCSALLTCSPHRAR